MSLRLIIEDDEGSTTIVPLGQDAITIGRQQGNTIQLTEKNVSRKHARLFPESDAWVIEDLGSYNGVKVNGRAVDGRIVLKEGDVVQIGDYHLALTEDVDRRAFNYDRPRSEPANDLEPMLVSSSTNLPRLTADELRAMSSGPQPVATPPPSPMFVDSGSVPATHPYPREAKKGGSGLLVALGIAVIGVVALGGVWFTMQGDKPDEPPSKATKNETKPPPPEPAPAKTEVKEVAPPPPQPTTAAEVAPPVADDDAGVEIEPGDGGAEVEPKPIEPKPTQPKPSDTKAAKPKPTEPKPVEPKPVEPKPVEPKPEPPEPAVDADALVAEAKKVQFSDPAKAYSLYSQAYNAKKSGDIAAQMVMAACRIPDAGKAQKAFAKVKSADKRQDLADVCAGKGITLTP